MQFCYLDRHSCISPYVALHVSSNMSLSKTHLNKYRSQPQGLLTEILLFSLSLSRSPLVPTQYFPFLVRTIMLRQVIVFMSCPPPRIPRCSALPCL